MTKLVTDLGGEGNDNPLGWEDPLEEGMATHSSSESYSLDHQRNPCDTSLVPLFCSFSFCLLLAFKSTQSVEAGEVSRLKFCL